MIRWPWDYYRALEVAADEDDSRAARAAIAFLLWMGGPTTSKHPVEMAKEATDDHEQ